MNVIVFKFGTVDIVKVKTPPLPVKFTKNGDDITLLNSPSPLAWIDPLTSSGYAGVDVPIPIQPFKNIPWPLAVVVLDSVYPIAIPSGPIVMSPEAVGAEQYIYLDAAKMAEFPQEFVTLVSVSHVPLVCVPFTDTFPVSVGEALNTFAPAEPV